jgi:hypothetical protein
MKIVKQWESITNNLVEIFLIKYFELEEEGIPLDYYWVGDDVGGILEFADYFFNLGDIKLCLEKDVPKDKFFAWYDWCLENPNEYINLQSFILGAAEVRQKQQEKLKRLKESIKFAKEVLKKYEILLF